MAAMSHENWSATTLTAEAISLAIFAWLVSLAAAVLVPRGRWLTVAAVLGNSAAVLPIAALVKPESSGPGR